MIQPLDRISKSFLIAAALAIPLIGSAKAEVANPALDWMAGHWCADMGGDTVEELWLPPHGGVMVGLGRTRNAERTTGFEYLRIADLDGIQSYIAQPGGRMELLPGEHPMKYSENDYNERHAECPEGISISQQSGNLDDVQEPLTL